ncbi:MAG: ABC transporter ATP-binding protein [Deltaproteobacteria bacterium]|nr:ABC transporter ATP-binding protein [Deltaproteobacteria bacterium]MCZ6622559.1 ABC transporter ATP-binding protein [Deltaproteobacteria bacterium]MCZ6907279.1 ABC transporter ATP-binding protein [Deltaproteobacteria bacterium]
MLSVEGVSSGYGRTLAIHDVDVKVENGEVVVLIGANGAGKSTLLKTISGVLRPQKGCILFRGRKIEGKRPHSIVKMGIVQIPEGRRILSRMTVMENLEMGAYVRSDEDGIKEDLERVFERFPRLKERLSQNAGTLSGGEQQMLAIGRGLMARPQLLLMDEPSLGLAPVIVESIFDTIHDLRKKDGYTILLAEQNANRALDVADRGYVLETGRIVLEGESKVLRDNEEVRKAYLGKAARNIEP